MAREAAGRGQAGTRRHPAREHMGDHGLADLRLQAASPAAIEAEQFFRNAAHARSPVPDWHHDNSKLAMNEIPGKI